MTRHEERKELLYVVFESCFKDDSVEEIFADATLCRDFIPTEFVEKGLTVIQDHMLEIDAHIIKNLKGWTFDRLPKTDICILRIAIYEMLYCEEIPESVAINEAVELAKEFGGEDTPAFINGVLSSVSKEVTAAE